MRGQVYTIAKLHYVNGIVYFVAKKRSTDISTLAKNSAETTKSGNVKHPRIRVRTLVRFAEGLGLLIRDGKEFVEISDLGRKYYDARTKDKWILSNRQKELLREYILADPTRSPTIHAITSLLSLVQDGHKGDMLARQYATAIGKENKWQSEATYEGFTNFGLDYLNELGFTPGFTKVACKAKGHREDASNWSNAELRASIVAYLEMLSMHRRSQTYVKKDYYRNLSEKFGRTVKSYEFRAQNISHVLALLGREWLPGLVPARNVGTNVIDRIERILAEVESAKPSGSAAFEARVRKSRKKKVTKKPIGNKNPKARISEATKYDRDPAVKAWVLENASGTCERCGAKAPFLTHDGLPFLEVHHVWLLAEGGPDCIENAVAVCPNCHRALHYSIDRGAIKEGLYSKFERLER